MSSMMLTAFSWGLLQVLLRQLRSRKHWKEVVRGGGGVWVINNKE